MGIFDWELRIKGLEGQVYGQNNLADRMNKLEEKYLKQQELLDRTLAVVEKMADKIHTHQIYNCKAKKNPLPNKMVDLASDPKIVDTTR